MLLSYSEEVLSVFLSTRLFSVSFRLFLVPILLSSRLRTLPFPSLRVDFSSATSVLPDVPLVQGLFILRYCTKIL